MLRLMSGLILSLCLPMLAMAESYEAGVIKSEFKRLLNHVQTLDPDGQIGGLMNYKVVGSYEILWLVPEEENENIILRIYNEHDDGSEDFALTYYNTTQIVEGRRVIRRFIGPALGGGWRNDTVDLERGDYLGSQGSRLPILNEEDHRILETWDIQLFD